MRLASDQLLKLVDASSMVLYRMNADWTKMLDLAGDGFLAEAIAGRDWLERYIPFSDRSAILSQIAEAIATRSPIEMEHRVVRADGCVRWIRSRALPSFNAGGEIVDWYGSAIDVTVKRNAEYALRENEARQAFLLKLSDAIRPLCDPRTIKAETTRLFGEYLECDRVLYVKIDEDTLTIEADYCRPGIQSIVGELLFRDFGLYAVETLLAGRVLSIADTSRISGLSDTERASFHGIGVAAFIAVPIIKEGRTRALLAVHQSTTRSWSPVEVLLAQEISDRTWEAGERARTEMSLRESEGHLRTLVAELQHRTHNLIGVVSTIASRTFRAHPNPEEFKTAFGESLKALSGAQLLLSRLEGGDRVTFDELLRSEFSSLATTQSEDGRITLDGPTGIQLRSSGIQTLVLALHELAVNACRHGALHAETGRLEVRWQLERKGDNKYWLQIDWRESGVPIVFADAPVGKGQGRELIEKALPYQLGARTSLKFTHDGVHCTIALPVSGTRRLPK